MRMRLPRCDHGVHYLPRLSVQVGLFGSCRLLRNARNFINCAFFIGAYRPAVFGVLLDLAWRRTLVGFWLVDVPHRRLWLCLEKSNKSQWSAK